jgi:aminoglycoside phosphotransferase family enzyme/predicted kinase
VSPARRGIRPFSCRLWNGSVSVVSGGTAVRETHISWVFLIGDRAYKLKKPVKMAFLDFSTPDKRRWACEREDELNRRFSPDVYLGVATLLDPSAALCDSIVVMRRMPDERRLATLVKAGADVHEHLRRIARLMAAYHAGAPTSPEISRLASLDAVRANWEDNFALMKDFYGPVLDVASATRIESLVRTYLEGRARLFMERIASGMARDGHGDLKADDIFCLDDRPRILDCIEFNDQLRYADVLADVAFLAMDLERLGAPALAAQFLYAYREFSAESHPDSLAHHYVAYRAHVRAKVECLRHGQGEISAAARARTLLGISLGHLERARVRMVLAGGFPASGKSTLANGLAERLGWALFRSDEVRRDVAGVAHDSPMPAAFDSGLYQPNHVEAAYTEMLRRARMTLERGVSVVLDATWRNERMREAARRVAESTCSELVELRCVAPMNVLEARLASRGPNAALGSDATGEVLAGMRFEEWASAREVDTNVEPERSLAAAIDIAVPEDRMCQPVAAG